MEAMVLGKMHKCKNNSVMDFTHCTTEWKNVIANPKHKTFWIKSETWWTNAEEDMEERSGKIILTEL